MSKLIKRLSGDFTIISNKVFRNKKLGVTDRGTLCTLLSLPDNWNFSNKKCNRYVGSDICDGCVCRTCDTLRTVQKERCVS